MIGVKMGCCHVCEVSPTQKTTHDQECTDTYRRNSLQCITPYLSMQTIRASSLSDMIAASYHQRSQSVTTVDSEQCTFLQMRALAVQDALQHGNFIDQKARELEDYVVSLQAQANWETLSTLEGVIIDVLKESRYSDSHPVIRAKMHFERTIRLSYLLAMIENPDIRAKWDYSLQQMNVLYVAEENYYIKNTTIWLTSPLITREFVEKCQVRKLESELRLVSFSTTHEVRTMQNFPRKEGLLRAETLFEMLQLQQVPDGVDMSLIYQADTLLGKGMSLDTEIHSLFDWMDRLQREVELTAL